MLRAGHTGAGAWTQLPCRCTDHQPFKRQRHAPHLLPCMSTLPFPVGIHRRRVSKITSMWFLDGVLEST